MVFVGVDWAEAHHDVCVGSRPRAAVKAETFLRAAGAS